MAFKLRMLLLLFPLLIIINSSAQCPTTITASSTSTAATCTSNGSITVTSNVGTTSGGLYQITEGPSGGGYQTSPQSSNIFNALPPGKYTITVSCGSAASTSTAVTVANSYTPVTLNAVVSNLCTNFLPGGTITLNTTGGSGSLQYAVLLSTNPAEPEASFTFGNSNIFDVSAYGTYQVRVKDACGNITARTVELIANTPKAKISTLTINNFQGRSNDVFGPVTSPSCGKLIVAINLADFTNGAPLGASATSKYKFEIWEHMSGGCPGTTPTGNPTQSGILDAAGDLNAIPLSYGITAFSWRLTTGCGEVTTGCQPVPAYTATVSPYIYPECGTSGRTLVTQSATTAFPVTLDITGFDAAGTQLFAQTRTQDSMYWKNIPVADHYTVKLTDNCGFSITKTNLKVQTSTPSVSFSYRIECTSSVGTGRVAISLASGNVPGWGTADPRNLRLISLSTGQQWSPQPDIRWNFSMNFYNVPPGNYTLKVPSSEGCVTNIPINVVANASAPLNNFTLNGSSTQTCSGTGTITSQVASNSTVAVTYKLLNQAGTTLQTNASGSFTNVAAGTYTVKAELAMCSGLAPLSSTKQFTILPAGANPQITKKVGITCDNGSTGMASFEFAGTAPFKLEMKKTTENAFVVKDAASPATKMVTALDPGAIYDVRITDPCGNTAVTSVAIEPLTALNKLTTASPCEGQPYTLAVDNIPGATYSWTFNGGAPMSTSSKIEFSSYSATNDGTYACTMTINNCIVRTATYTISSKNCGSPLYVSFGNISASQKNGKLFVNWTSETEKDNVLFEIEASNDGKEFIKIGTVNSKAKEGNSSEKIAYSFELSVENATAMASIFSILLMTAVYKRRNRLASAFAAMLVIIAIGVSCKKTSDENLSTNGHQYIRIVTLDKQGNKGFSKVVKVIKD